MAVNYLDSTDPRKLAQNQRDILMSKGDQLNQEAQDQGDQATQQYGQYTNFLDPIEQNLAQGNGGYTPQELGQIENSGRVQSMEMNPDQAAAIQGNTASYNDYFNPNVTDSQLASYQNDQKSAVGDLQNQLHGAIDPQALQQSNDYLKNATSQLSNNSSNFNNVLGSAANNVRGSIDSSAVSPSSQFLSDYQMTPKEQQDIVTGAGISAGTGYRASVDDLQRQAAAAGANPMGVAAYRARQERSAAAAAGDAMTQARIAASNAAAQREMQGEQLRENAGQYLTNVKTGTEMQLGQEALQGTQDLGQQALNQYNTQEQNRQGAQQYLTGAQLNAAATGGQAAIQNAQTATGQQQQNQQFNAQTGTGIRQAQDTANSNRAAQIQGTQYGQAANTAGMQSGQAQAAGNARINQQNTGIGAQENRASTANQNAQNAYGRQQQNYSTQSNATNQAANIGLNASQTPTTFDKIAGGVSGALGAAAGFLEDGGIATKPTLAVVGEHGPERVVKIDGYRARTYQQKQPVARKRATYGEVA